MDPDQVNLNLVEHLIEWIIDGDHEYPTDGSILVFLPGIAEIMALYDQLNTNSTLSPKKNKCVIL